MSSDDDDDINFRSDEPLSLFQRLRVMIGYDLSEETKLELACKAHLDARRALEDSKSRFKAAQQQQMLSAEKLQRLSAEGVNNVLIRQAKDAMLEGMAAFTEAKKDLEEKQALVAKAREKQKMRFNRVADLEGHEVAVEVVKEAMAGWWEESMDDGNTWWNG